ncbi:MAG: TonB-dependent receptor [Brumimicrobium sp.]|nr:TonB-dependent receptor [Brumimicrobium sp.]
MKNILLVFLLAILSFLSFGQEMKFTGTVNDTTNQTPLSDAVIMAVRLKDGLLLGFTRSNADGSFELRGVPIDTMELVISHYSFDEKRFYIIGSADNYEINIPNIILPEQATELEEVIVYANKEPIYFRGDTLVYVADSFAVKENAVVEDLLKNLPGISVDENGNVSSQGRQVTKVLVDGDEFFGSDPTIATRNLRADGVDKVEIYETEDDRSGGNTEEKIQVLDVKLKDDAKKGYFGKVAGAGGFNTEYFDKKPNGRIFYQGELLANYFNKDLKVSVFGLGSNTPNTGFSYRDASRFGLTNEMKGGWMSTLTPTRVNGLPENYKAGFYFSNKLGKKVKLGVNYTYNDSRIITEDIRDGQYFFKGFEGITKDSTYNKVDSTYNSQMQQSHTVNLQLDYDINDKTTLTLKSNFVYRDEKQEKNSFTNFIDSKDNRFSANDIHNKNKADGMDANIELNFNRKFEKKYREFNATYQFGYTQMERETELNSNLYFIQFVTPDSTFDQQRQMRNKTTGHRLLLDYTEPISRQFRLKFQYRLDYFYGNQITETFDRTPTGYDGFSPMYSADFTNDRIENRGSAGIYFANTKQTLEVGARIRNVLINNLNNTLEVNINQNVTDVLPYLEYQYKFSNAQRLRLTYTTSSDQPSLDQLQPIRDNTDPNSLVIGNPDLKPNYNHSLQLFYNKWNAINQSFIYAGGYYTYMNNAFSNAIFYLPTGHSVSTAINVDGNMLGGFYAGTGFPVFKKILRIRPQASGGYSNFKTEINKQLNIIQNYNLDGSLTLEVRSDTMEVSLSASYSYNYPMSNLSMGLNEPYLVQRYKASIYFDLPFRFIIESDATYEINSRRAEGYNLKPFIWNAKLSRRFLKTGNLVIHFEVNDIFNKNVGISRNVGTNVITDMRSRVIARYFMIGATWRFNNSKTKEDEGKNMWF